MVKVEQGVKAVLATTIVTLLTLSAATGVVQATCDPGCPGGGEPGPFGSFDATVTSHDGVQLAVTLWYNESIDSPAPVILGGHGWAGNRGDLADRAHWLADAGYIVLAWDARGFGESGGSVNLNGPDEWNDVTALIDWLVEDAQLPAGVEILMDAGDNPRIGMIGNSYGGAIQLLASAHDERIDAIVPNIAWHDLVHSLAPESLIKRGWVDLLFASGHASSRGLMSEPPNPNTGGMDPRLNEWYLEATLTGRAPASAIGPLTERSPMTYLENVKAHALITQGYNDTLFLPDEAVANYDALNGRADAETNLLFHTKGHGHSMTQDEEETYRAILLKFYDRHLRQTGEPALPDVLYFDPAQGAYQSATTWPPTTTQESDIPLSAGTDSDTVTLAQLPAPTSHTEWWQFSGMYNDNLGPLHPEHLDASGATSVLLMPDITTIQSWPLPQLNLAGRPSVAFGVTPDVNELSLFVSLVDTTTNDVIYNQVTPKLIEGKKGQRVELDIALSSLAYTLDGGNIAVRVTTSDTGIYGSREPGTATLHLEDAELRLPFA
jgi:ABC-2 type transport system ATP-binding protein